MSVELTQLMTDFGYTQKEQEYFREFAVIWLKQKRHTQLKNGSMYDIHTLDELLEELSIVESQKKATI